MKKEIFTQKVVNVAIALLLKLIVLPKWSFRKAKAQRCQTEHFADGCKHFNAFAVCQL